MRAAVPLVAVLLMSWLSSATPVQAWEEGDRQAYNNKMSLLKVLVDGAKDRASDRGDLETLCLLMSIGNDVTLRYVQLNPEDQQIKTRLLSMRTDMTSCLALLNQLNQAI
ncbi:MAG: hypothetical protein ACPHGV_09665 [Synechococcus sp.]